MSGLAALANSLLETGHHGERPDARFKQWATGVTNEVILVERSWYRARVLRHRQYVDGRLGDPDYLMHSHRALKLMLALHDALEEATS